MTETTGNRSMLPQAMRDVVIDNGGRVDREIYFTEVHQLIHDNGGDTALESLRTSTVAKGRLEAAGLTKVDIGSSKQIWLSELAEAATGATTGSTAPAMSMKPAPTTTSGTTTAPNVFAGITHRDISDYPADIQTLIQTSDSGYIEQGLMGSELFAMAFAFNNNMHLMTEGGTGCGKTMAIGQFSYLTGLPRFRVNGRDGLDFADLQGYMTATTDGAGNVVSAFVDGQLTKAMRYGGIFYLDECNFIKPSVAGGLNQILDAGVMDIPMTGEVLHAHPDFRVFASMNPNYAGTTRMNQATRRRFGMTIQFDYLSPTLEAQVIQAQSGVANQDAADELVAFATDLRKMNSDDRFAEPTDIGTATLVTAMTCLAQFNMSQVLEATILPLFDVDDVDDVMTVARGRFSDL